MSMYESCIIQNESSICITLVATCRTPFSQQVVVFISQRDRDLPVLDNHTRPHELKDDQNSRKIIDVEEIPLGSLMALDSAQQIMST